ncbi:MAG TPA: chromate transporter [Clostridiales bacterium]|nr:chromate transporter [Clostridiales bacterium]
MILYLRLLWVFFRVGAVGFGGGYAMMSMIIDEAVKFAVTPEELASLTALDMVVPGPIAINAATFVGYLSGGFWGSLFATIGVSLPSFLIITLVMKFLDRYRENKVMQSFLGGVKPAAVGLIASAAITIASGVLLLPDADISAIFTNPLGVFSVIGVVIFVVAAFANIKFNINPIILTLLAGAIGAFLL